MPRLVVPWLINLGLPLLLLILAWGCGGTATLIEPARIAKASAAPRRPRPHVTPAPIRYPTPRRSPSGR